MIGRIAGVLLDKAPPQIIVDVQGVGYEIEVPMSTFYVLPASGERVSLFTHLVVREDAQLLYGFASETERRVFRQLIRISGIGARTALALLSGMSVTELVGAVSRQEAARLIKVPGIGRKTAERLLLELKDKLAADAAIAQGAAAGTPRSVSDDVVHALIALGYSEKEASQAVKQLPEGLTLSDGIRQALRMLAKS